MRRLIQVVVVVSLVVVVGGLLVPAIGNVRNAANLSKCHNNLKQIGLALHNYHACNNRFPAAALPNPDLPTERRLSWLVELCPAYMEGGTVSALDKSKAWDADVNCPPYFLHPKDHTKLHLERKIVGTRSVWHCPANHTRTDPSMPGPTNYVGVAGVGEDAASLPLSDPKAGFFGHDRHASPADIKNGTATTLALAEVVDGGPWTAGGRATVRGLTAGSPYLGEGGQFSAFHRSSKFSSQAVVTNVLFADGSVRRLTAAVSPQVFEALATIAGNEQAVVSAAIQ